MEEVCKSLRLDQQNFVVRRVTSYTRWATPWAFSMNTVDLTETNSLRSIVKTSCQVNEHPFIDHPVWLHNNYISFCISETYHCNVVCCFVGYERNFLKFSTKFIDSLNVPYDYGSIMHYGKTFFSKLAQLLPTMTILKESDASGNEIEIGQRVALSDMDVLQANLLYKCDGRSSSLRLSSCLLVNSNFLLFVKVVNDFPMMNATSLRPNTLTLRHVKVCNVLVRDR